MAKLIPDGLTEHESIIQMIRAVTNEQTSVYEGFKTCHGRRYQDSCIKVSFTKFTHDIEVYVIIDRNTGKFVFKTERWWSKDGQSFKEYPQFSHPGPWIDHLKRKCGFESRSTGKHIKQEEEP